MPPPHADPPQDADDPVRRRPGRPRIWANDAEKVRAHRERKAAEAAGRAQEAQVVPLSPAQAPDTLVSAVRELAGFGPSLRDALAPIVDRIEAATTMLGDAEALQAWIEGERADVGQVRADAEARVRAAEAQRVAATRAAEAAENKARDAEAAAEAAADAMEAMQDEIDDLADQLAASQRRTEETAREHADQLDRLLVEHTAALADRDRLHAAELAAAHGQVTAAEQDRKRAQDDTDRARRDLDAARQDTASLRAEIPAQIRQARQELTDTLTQRYAAELAQARAEIRAEITEAKATELAEALAATAAAKALAERDRSHAAALTVRLAGLEDQ